MAKLKKKENHMKFKEIQREKGITLIALVITIIVLLILAGISIAMLTGQNGILTQAQNSKQATKKAEVKEKAQTDIVGVQTATQSTEISKIALKGIFLSTNISAAFFPSSKVIPVFISILFLSKGIPNLAKASLYPLTRSMEL